jgi:hypothetical protein
MNGRDWLKAAVFGQTVYQNHGNKVCPMFRISALSIAILSVSGCKLAVLLVEGGEVQSLGSGTCQVAVPGVTGTVCIHEVSDTSYSETFTAVAAPGWQFVKWNDGDGFICAGSTNPTCVVSNTFGAGDPLVESHVASSATYYIMPVFSDSVPITDTVLADGREWAQPGLFAPISWNDIDTVCPVISGGACSGNLKGWDMNGWTWASVPDLNSLFNTYLLLRGVSGDDLLGPTDPDIYSETFGPFYEPFFDDGWRQTATVGILKLVDAWSSTVAPGPYGAYHPAYSTITISIAIGVTANTSEDGPWQVEPGFDPIPHHPGGWFYRTP